MGIILLVLYVLFSASSSTAAAAFNDESTIISSTIDDDDFLDAQHDEGFVKLVAWMKLHGGRVDPRFDVSSSTMNNGNGNTNNSRTSIRGIIAHSSIPDGTELLFCPWKLVIGSTSLQDQMKKGDGMCHVVTKMADEIRRQSDSFWFPYLDHMMMMTTTKKNGSGGAHAVPQGLPRLVATWDPSALEELQGIPPRQDATRHIQWYHQSCTTSSNSEGSNNKKKEITMRSLVAFVSRASQVGMIPLYDLLNHHNGKRNAKLRLVDDGVQLVVVGGTIDAGQELYLSHGVKTASTMYRDYGFTEDWPTCWNFKDQQHTNDNFVFVLFPDGIAAISPSADYLQQLWESNARSLLDYQTNATRHTESLSMEDLERFAYAAQRHLESFPSTLQDDQGRLEDLKRTEAEQQQQQTTTTGTSTTEDIIHAIEYRIAFKSALTSSSKYAESMVRKMRDQKSGLHQEL